MSQFPATPAPSSLKFSSVQPTLVSMTHDLTVQTRSRGGQRWLLALGWSILDRASWAAFFAFSVAQRGRYGTFTYVLPGNMSTPQGVATGTPLINGANQSGRSIVTDGWAHGVTGIMKAGDFVKFDGHAKVYMLTADVNSDSGGNATLAIEPALMATPADNEALTVSNIPFQVQFDSDQFDSNVAPAYLYDFNVTLRERP